MESDIFDILIGATFICSIKSDTDQMYCNVTTVWTIMSMLLFSIDMYY